MHECSPAVCVEKVKEGFCGLYADDELFLRYTALNDPDLEVNKEIEKTQYMVWPVRDDLSQGLKGLLDKWMYTAIADGSLDGLYHKHFEVMPCPIGTAGKDCSEPCDPRHGEADRNGHCICESTKWSGADCSVEVMENTNLIPSGLKIGGYVMFGINLAAILASFVWLCRHKGTPQVEAAQPFFLHLLLLGCLISSSTVIALAQEDKGDGPVHACMAVPWLYSAGFCVTFGSLFAKIRRVYILFRSSAAMIRVTVSVRETCLIIVAILFVDVIILMIWTIVDPLQWTRTVSYADKYGEPLASYGYCTSEHWAAFAGSIAALHLSVQTAASYLCYLARNIPTKFSEGKYLILAMVSNLQVFLIGVPILIIVGTNPQSSFFVRSAIICINDFAVLGLIFGNLMYSVYTNQNNISINTAIIKFSDRSINGSIKRQGSSMRSLEKQASSLPSILPTNNHEDQEVASFTQNKDGSAKALNVSFKDESQQTSGTTTSQLSESEAPDSTKN